MKKEKGYTVLKLRNVELVVFYEYYYELPKINRYKITNPHLELEITNVFKDDFNYLPILERHSIIYPLSNIKGELENIVKDCIYDLV